MDFIVQPSAVTDATVTVPGDKSISHRALMLGGIANGQTSVRGFLPGEDCLSTLAAMAAMGVEIRREATDEVVINGVGLRGLVQPAGELQFGTRPERRR